MEYIILVGIFMVIVIPLFYYALTTSSENIKQSQAEETVSALALGADEIYALSPGSKKFVWISLPGSVSAVQMMGNEITLSFTIGGRETEATAFTKGSLVGQIKLEKGTYRVPIELLSSGAVQIGEANDTVAPRIVAAEPLGLACNPVVLRATTDEPSQCHFDQSDSTYHAMGQVMLGNSLGHSFTLGVLSAGNYQYYVRCADSFNNVMGSSAGINFSVNLSYCLGSQNSSGNGSGIGQEAVPPQITLMSPVNGYISNSSQIFFNYTVIDASAVQQCQLLVNQSVTASAISPSQNQTNTLVGDLNLGNYIWSVSCTDVWGNAGHSAARNLTVNAVLDSDFPVVLLTSPTNNSVRSYNLVEFRYNVTDITSSVSSCTLGITSFYDSGGSSHQDVTDNSIMESAMQNYSLSLEKGNQTWNISCKDSSIYHNEGVSATWQFRVNQTMNGAFIISCPGECGFEGYSNGVCRQEPTKCTQNNEVYSLIGDQYCTGGSQADTCCCIH